MSFMLKLVICINHKYFGLVRKIKRLNIENEVVVRKNDKLKPT